MDLIVNLEEHAMIRKVLLGAACAAFIIAPAHAGIRLQGRTFNGIGLNGFTLNGNGTFLQGPSIQGLQLNGVRPNAVGVNVGGHGGVGLNGMVIAIEL
jgi:hypothetical protein